MISNMPYAESNHFSVLLRDRKCVSFVALRLVLASPSQFRKVYLSVNPKNSVFLTRTYA